MAVRQAQATLWLLLLGHAALLALFWGFLQLSLASLFTVLLAALLAMVIVAGLLAVHASVLGMIAARPPSAFSFPGAVRAARRTAPRLIEALLAASIIGLSLHQVPRALAAITALPLPAGIDLWGWSSLRETVRGGFPGLWGSVMAAGFLPALVVSLVLEAQARGIAVRRLRGLGWESVRRWLISTVIFLGCSIVFLAIPQALVQWQAPPVRMPWLEIGLLGARLAAACLLVGYGWGLALTMAAVHWRIGVDGGCRN